MTQIRILIADDHDLVRLGIRSVLNHQPDFLIVCEASDGVEAVTRAKQYQPDVVLLDLSMPNLNGIAATPVIREVAPNAKVLIVTDHESPAFVRQAFAAGARGYVPKVDVARALAVAVRQVSKGGTFCSERLKIAAQQSPIVSPALDVAAHDD